jgi:beta-glucosidase
VLLENRNGALPLKPGLRKLAVIGPTADNGDVLLGNYHGTPSKQVTILEGIRKEAGERGAEVLFSAGSDLVGEDTTKFAEAVDTAKKADVVVLVLGLSPRLEGEEGERKENPSGDRHEIGLPPIQEKLMNAVLAARKPTVLVLTGGSALAANTARAKIPGILMAWYPGQDGGLAVAEALYGETNPGGRLPLTFYKSTKDLPGFSDYSMKNRTYRYYTGEPLWPFGHGLSYTSFTYGNLKVSTEKLEAGKPVVVTVDVENTGKVAGDEVVQLYVTDDKASVPVPLRSLAGFQRVSLRPGDRRSLTFELPPRALSIVDDQGRRIIEPGTFTIAVGGRQPGRGNKFRSAKEGLSTRVQVEGQTVALQ